MPAFNDRAPFDHCDILDALGKVVHNVVTDIGVGDLPAAEADGHLHFVTGVQAWRFWRRPRSLRCGRPP